MTRSRAHALLRLVAVTVLFLVLAPRPSAPVVAAGAVDEKLDSLLRLRLFGDGRSRVVLRAATPGALGLVATQTALLGGRVVRRLPGIDALAIEVPNRVLGTLAANPLVARISHDRPVAAAMDRTSTTIGARAVRDQLHVDGTGIGVAVIDSGITPWHDDLGDGAGGQRVTRFVDFVNGRPAAYDDYGHGTHVAGIIAGNGFDSSGARTGVAPGVHLIALKVLDAAGQGRISDVIAALDYVVANKDALNIRVVNLSVAGGVHESYQTDPLTLAAKRAVSAGIVVVAAAGNNGRGPSGRARYSGVTSPGNAPWVLTVGASSHMGTTERDDDTMAAFSSRGPGAIDYGAKPDLVAPGVGIESLADASSALYAASNAALLNGTVASSQYPYMSLTGSSMAAPLVTGTIALMLQANPALTPNASKAILQYTAQSYPGHDFLTQGAGFLNAKGAVDLASYLSAPATTPYPSGAGWSRHLIWGNHLAHGGRLSADANAWPTSVTWGAGASPDGARIRWGFTCSTTACDEVTTKPWQTVCADLLCTLLAGDALQAPNVVWGARCAGLDCPLTWTASSVTATSDPEADTVVWGTSDTEGDTVVWGTSCRDPACEPVVWDR
jgi:serine protease AprX